VRILSVALLLVCCGLDAPAAPAPCSGDRPAVLLGLFDPRFSAAASSAYAQSFNVSLTVDAAGKPHDIIVTPYDAPATNTDASASPAVALSIKKSVERSPFIPATHNCLKTQDFIKLSVRASGSDKTLKIVPAKQ